MTDTLAPQAGGIPLYRQVGQHALVGREWPLGSHSRLVARRARYIPSGGATADSHGLSRATCSTDPQVGQSAGGGSATGCLEDAAQVSEMVAHLQR
jgi:hypothetical protein